LRTSKEASSWRTSKHRRLFQLSTPTRFSQNWRFRFLQIKCGGRVTNTAKDKKRGQIVPYADPRAYADRLNALFTPQGWTREYNVDTMSNIMRVKKGESIVSGKILVTCTVTIVGLWSHSGTGKEWADDENGMTSADAQAFKRACACFGLGRYFYEFQGSWVDLDQHQQPKRIPALPVWAIPENWRKGMRPPGKNCNDGFHANGANGSSNGNPKPNGRQASACANSSADELDTRIAALEKAVGPGLYRSVSPRKQESPMHINAIKHICRLRSGSQAQLMTGDDGHEYVVKFKG